MTLEQRAAPRLLKALLAVLFTILVMLQTFSLPGQFAHMAREDPDAAHLRWPATAIAVIVVLCVQVVVVCIWKLLTMVTSDRIFSDDALRWVDVIIAAIATGWVVLLGVLVFVGFQADDPGAPILLFLVVVGVGVVALLMVVMRGLLEQATSLRTDLDGVI